MKALKCEMCGSNDVVKQEDLFVCQNCGTKYSVEAARKMMIEGTVEVKGSVKIDDSVELENLFNLARRYKNADDQENALKYYEMVLIKDPNSWEANFYVVYFRSVLIPVMDYYKLNNPVANCLDLTFSLIQERETDNEIIQQIISELYTRCTYMATKLSHKNRVENAIAGAEILYCFGTVLEDKFGARYKEYIVNSWKYGIQIHNNPYLASIDDDVQTKNGTSFLLRKNYEEQKKIMDSYAEKIKKYDPSYVFPGFNSERSYFGFIFVIVILTITLIITLLTLGL